MYKWKVEVEENTQLSFWRKVKWSSDKFDKFALKKFLTVLFAAGSSEENPSERSFFEDLSPRFKVNCCFLSRVLMSTGARDCLPPRLWVIWVSGRVAIFQRQRGVQTKVLSMVLDRKRSRDWRPMIRSRLEPIYGRFPSVDPLGRFAGVPILGKPLKREKTGRSLVRSLSVRSRDCQIFWDG